MSGGVPVNRGPNFYRRHTLTKAESELLSAMVKDYGIPAVATVTGIHRELLRDIVDGMVQHLTTIKRVRSMLEQFSRAA